MNILVPLFGYNSYNSELKNNSQKCWDLTLTPAKIFFQLALVAKQDR